MTKSTRLSPKAAAARLGLSIGRVRQLIASGAIRAVNIGLDRPLWAIDETELARFAALERPGHRPRKETEMMIAKDNPIPKGETPTFWVKCQECGEEWIVTEQEEARNEFLCLNCGEMDVIVMDHI